MTVSEYCKLFDLDGVKTKKIGFSNNPRAEHMQDRVSGDTDICEISNFIAPLNGGTLFDISHKQIRNYLLREYEKNKEAYLPPELTEFAGGIKGEKILVVPTKAFVKLHENIPKILGVDDIVIWYPH